MTEKIIIVEVGSTNTKSALCMSDGKIINLYDKHIPFKKNYSKKETLDEKNIKDLCNYINEINNENLKVFVYGTSIFRKLSEKVIRDLKKTIKEKKRFMYEKWYS